MAKVHATMSLRGFSTWDLLLVGLLISPLATGAFFLNTMSGLLTVEVVPVDQANVPVPHEGDIVEVYGTWVRDGGHFLGDTGWNEIHPGIFLRNITTGVEGGNEQCTLLVDVHGPERLLLLDPTDPCKWARGNVQSVFAFNDGDIHIDLLLDPQHQFLAKSNPPVFIVAYPTAVLLVAASIIGFGLPYAVVSKVRPRRTVVGKLILKLLRLAQHGLDL